MSEKLAQPFRGDRSEIASDLVDAAKRLNKTCGEFAFFHFLAFGYSSAFAPPRRHRGKHRDTMFERNMSESCPESYVHGLVIFRDSFKRDESRIETLQKAFEENIDFIIGEALKEDKARSAELALTE